MKAGAIFSIGTPNWTPGSNKTGEKDLARRNDLQTSTFHRRRRFSPFLDRFRPKLTCRTAAPAGSIKRALPSKLPRGSLA
jgi:hypothetical protein